MPVQTYSSGMKSRLTFGLSMSFKFDVYLIDELTAVGDRAFRQKAKEAFDNFKSRAQLVYVSHNLDNLKASCEAVVLVCDGNAVFYPDLDDGIAAYEERVEQVRNQRKQVRRQSGSRGDAPG
jgi:capsular polysaccharide transport system ATP-binding protein